MLTDGKAGGYRLDHLLKNHPDVTITSVGTESLNPATLKRIQGWTRENKLNEWENSQANVKDMPPVEVVRTPHGDYLYDGTHRTEFATRQGEKVPATVYTIKTKGDAVTPVAPKIADVKAKAAELKPTTAIETPEFKAWFGDWQDPHAFSSKRDPKTPQVSMAINEDGTPRVFYHGTQGDFDTFESGRPTKNTGMMGIPYDATRAGIFFTPDAAHTGDWLREWDRRGNAGVARNGNVMPVYLNIKAPLDLDNVLKGHNPLDEDARSEFEKEGINPRWFNSVQHSWELFDDADGKNFVAAAKRLGYDGATIKEEDLDGNEHDVWVAFDPEQIKSAIGNKGTFDPKKASILLGIPLAAGALTLAQVKAKAEELKPKSVQLRDPHGYVHTFPNQQAADNFKREAGIQ